MRHRFDDLHDHHLGADAEILHHRVGDVFHQRLLGVLRSAFDEIDDDLGHGWLRFWTRQGPKETRSRQLQDRITAQAAPGSVRAAAPAAASDRGRDRDLETVRAAAVKVLLDWRGAWKKLLRPRNSRRAPWFPIHPDRERRWKGAHHLTV
jgi:hypothetical protein